jgi:hypothetical protein
MMLEMREPKVQRMMESLRIRTSLQQRSRVPKVLLLVVRMSEDFCNLRMLSIVSKKKLWNVQNY